MVRRIQVPFAASRCHLGFPDAHGCCVEIYPARKEVLAAGQRSDARISDDLFRVGYGYRLADGIERTNCRAIRRQMLEAGNHASQGIGRHTLRPRHSLPLFRLPQSW